jgi:hypothetical protein
MLRCGCLNLFLGAGVSKGFGLPEWPLLIARILGKGKDTSYLQKLRAMNDKELSTLIDPVDDGKPDFYHRVHKALYSGVKADLPDQLSASPLLLAVAALITGSCRGRIETVFTYNYDDLLEQYLAMLGYAICRRIDPFDFSTRADLVINHVHGFLPQSWERGNSVSELILSEKSYRTRRAGIDAGWSSCVEQSLYSKAALFIGLSGDDGAMLDVLARAKNSVKRVADTDYHGYWLVTPDAYNRNHVAMLDVKMCPIPIDKKMLPKFVFEICQKALPK